MNLHHGWRKFTNYAELRPPKSVGVQSPHADVWRQIDLFIDAHIALFVYTVQCLFIMYDTHCKVFGLFGFMWQGVSSAYLPNSN